MLAVLSTMRLSLRHTRSTRATLPRRIAKWLNVPPGKTASGGFSRPTPTANAAALASARTAASWMEGRRRNRRTTGTES